MQEKLVPQCLRCTLIHSQSGSIGQRKASLRFCKWLQALIPQLWPAGLRFGVLMKCFWHAWRKRVGHPTFLSGHFLLTLPLILITFGNHFVTYWLYFSPIAFCLPLLQHNELRAKWGFVCDLFLRFGNKQQQRKMTNILRMTTRAQSYYNIYYA